MAGASIAFLPPLVRTQICMLNKRAQIWRKVFQPTDKDFKHYHLHVEVRQNRNVHDYLADLDSEVPLYMKVKLLNPHFHWKKLKACNIFFTSQAGQLVNFLSSWTPPPSSEPLSPQHTVCWD